MDYRISIPKPCHEDWTAMTPNKQGRFCMQCSKIVTDFTGMKALEIQSYLLENSSNMVCGRFKSTQLDTITITIPERVLFTQTKFRNVFLLALLISMGTTLFSCNDGQKIDKVTIVETNTATATQDTIKCESTTAQSDSSDAVQIRLNELRPIGKVELTGAVVVDPIPPKYLKPLDHVLVGEVAPIMTIDSLPKKDADSIK